MFYNIGVIVKAIQNFGIITNVAFNGSVPNQELNQGVTYSQQRAYGPRKELKRAQGYFHNLSRLRVSLKSYGSDNSIG